jgi:hypothetical protein
MESNSLLFEFQSLQIFEYFVGHLAGIKFTAEVCSPGAIRDRIVDSLFNGTGLLL